MQRQDEKIQQIFSQLTTLKIEDLIIVEGVFSTFNEKDPIQYSNIKSRLPDSVNSIINLMQTVFNNAGIAAKQKKGKTAALDETINLLKATTKKYINQTNPAFTAKLKFVADQILRIDSLNDELNFIEKFHQLSNDLLAGEYFKNTKFYAVEKDIESTNKAFNVPELDRLRTERNKLSVEIKELEKQSVDVKEKIQQRNNLNKQIEKIEQPLNEKIDKLHAQMIEIKNPFAALIKKEETKLSSEIEASKKTLPLQEVCSGYQEYLQATIFKQMEKLAANPDEQFKFARDILYEMKQYSKSTTLMQTAEQVNKDPSRLDPSLILALRKFRLVNELIEILNQHTNSEEKLKAFKEKFSPASSLLEQRRGKFAFFENVAAKFDPKLKSEGEKFVQILNYILEGKITFEDIQKEKAEYQKSLRQ